MSEIKKSALINQFTIPEILDRSLGALESLFDSVFGDDEDAFENESHFRAVVITNPKTILPHEYKALGFAGSENKMDQGKFKKFKVRITHKQNNPHAVLQDPCDITFAADKCEQNALVALHTTVVSEEHKGLNIGSYVTIRLQKHSSGIYNLQTAELVNILGGPNTTGNTTLSQETCDSIKAYFTYGEAYEPPPAVEMPSELRRLAELYDETDIPGKNNALISGFKPHSAYVNGKGSDAVKPPFQLWVKALIYRAYEEGFTIQITSGFRDPVYQEKLHKERKAAKARGEDVLPAACGLCPTRSRHTFGMAIDLNFYDTSGTLITSNSLKNEWLATGFPQIAMSAPLFLRWGGNFKNYDPVHFDFNPPDWGDNVQQFLDSLGGNGVDTLSTGGNTPGETAANERDVAEGDFMPEEIRLAAAAAAEEGALADQEPPDLVGELGDY